MPWIHISFKNTTNTRFSDHLDPVSLSEVPTCSLPKVTRFSYRLNSVGRVNLNAQSNKLKLASKWSHDTVALTFFSQFVSVYCTWSSFDLTWLDTCCCLLFMVAAQQVTTVHVTIHFDTYTNCRETPAAWKLVGPCMTCFDRLIIQTGCKWMLHRNASSRWLSSRFYTGNGPPHAILRLFSIPNWLSGNPGFLKRTLTFYLPRPSCFCCKYCWYYYYYYYYYFYFYYYC